ncbi:MAG: hypothetical protein KAK00_01420 [Nanoarchaeota archaeon]|nr:hypothetical protein [Nanoarchaeota archaeon]
MKYNLVLAVDAENPEKLFQIIQPEINKKKRSEIKVKKEKQKIILEVSAIDAIALKASTNLLLKILEIYEKSKELIE